MEIYRKDTETGRGTINGIIENLEPFAASQVVLADSSTGFLFLNCQTATVKPLVCTKQCPH